MKYYELTYENIEKALAEATGFLEKQRLTEKEILRTRLMLEETFLNYRETMGKDGSFCMVCRRKLGSLRLELRFPGGPMDLTREENESEIMRGILSQNGYAPVWQYVGQGNLVLFTPRKPRPSQVKLLLAAILGAILLGALSKLLPAALTGFLTGELLTPLFNTFMGLISGVAGPMIFLSVAWGIFSIGDTATLGRIGKRMITRFLLMSLVTAVISAGMLLCIYPMKLAGGAVMGFHEIRDLILNMVPGNLLTPFTEGNPVQIIFIAAMVGGVMLMLEGKIPVVAGFVDQTNRITQRIMEALSSLIPFFVFSSVFSMIAGGNLSGILGMGKLIVIIAGGELLISLLYLLLVALHRKVNPVLLMKKALPATLIGFATASSSAAMAANLESCQKDLGIDEKIVNFGVPLGQVVFMPGAIVQFLAISFYMAQVYGIEMTTGRLLTSILITVMLGVAAPPVPGGGLTCYTMLFLQLGIPTEAIAMLITFNIVLEFIATGVNLLALQLELTELAGSLRLLDLGRLRQR